MVGRILNVEVCDATNVDGRFAAGIMIKKIPPYGGINDLKVRMIIPLILGSQACYYVQVCDRVGFCGLFFLFEQLLGVF